ncbi:hypothetical protein OHA72_03665 [Dactylosporangium sp. NBC_01737]|uniref:hypothetical protein n=1 Tax=Dactylosporangium sp. NBC_01737 TaxID=2975959 RepID=UPI002E0F4970|nr:hypothetical protein OHA72_03665 [Dactylosporangium sp. NBC_01737]
MTQPTSETPQHGTDAQHGTDLEQPPADEQPTMRLAPADPDATRPMSLADLLNSD